jgi:serpin B
MRSPVLASLARRGAPLLVAASLLVPANAERPGPPPAPPDPRAVELAATLAAGQNAFALDLYGRLKDQPGNLLFSAYSIQTALAMARAGARGETAAQMDRALHLPKDATPEAWKALVATVTTAPPAEEYENGRVHHVPAYSVSVANALFGQRGYAFVPAYRQLVASAYGA